MIVFNVFSSISQFIWVIFFFMLTSFPLSKKEKNIILRGRTPAIFEQTWIYSTISFFMFKVLKQNILNILHLLHEMKINIVDHLKLKSCVLAASCQTLRSLFLPSVYSSSEFKETTHWLLNSSKQRIKNKNETNINVTYRDVWIKTLPESVSHQKHSCRVWNLHIGIFSCILMEPYLQNWTCESVTISEAAQVIYWAELCKCIPRCRAGALKSRCIQTKGTKRLSVAGRGCDPQAR